MDDRKHIEKATKLMEHCVFLNKEIRKPLRIEGISYRTADMISRERQETFKKACFDFVEYLLDNFKGPRDMTDEELEEFRKYFNQIHDKSTDLDNPPYPVDNYTFPLHAVKLLMDKHHIFLPVQCGNYRELAAKYMKLMY